MAAGRQPSETDARALRRTVSSARVLVIGSLNIDLILELDGEPEDDSAVVVRSTSTEVGGHAGNCAAALAALGVSVAVAGAVGVDEDGDRLLADLRGRGVDVAGVRLRPGLPTGRVVIPVHGDRHHMMLIRGANDSFGADDLREVLRATDCDAVMLFDPAREALCAVGAAFEGLTRRPLLCWTPGGVFAADQGVAAAVLPHCDVVFVNRAEWRHLAGLAPLRPHTELVTTLGDKGSTLRRGESELTVAVRRVPVVDPTGAGDAFAAAYLVARLADLAAETRLTIANLSGAHAVGVVGARASQAALADLVSRVAP